MTFFLLLGLMSLTLTAFFLMRAFMRPTNSRQFWVYLGAVGLALAAAVANLLSAWQVWLS